MSTSAYVQHNITETKENKLRNKEHRTIHKIYRGTYLGPLTGQRWSAQTAENTPREERTNLMTDDILNLTQLSCWKSRRTPR